MEGDILGRMRLDIADVQHKLGRVEALMTRSMASIEKKSRMTSQAMVKDTKAFMHVSRGAARTFSLDWWKRFGEVAIGFSIAYRAMMAVELAIRSDIQTFKIGLDAIDDFNMGVISIAASLQMLTEIPSKKSLEAYLKFGEIMFKKMEILAIRHFATGEQLQMAFTKMITLGIVPMTEKQLEGMAALVDRILMATRGLDAGRQIMTEIQAVIEGMQRPGAVVARELKSLVPHYKELIAAMGKEPDIVKRTAMFFDAIVKPLEAVSSVSEDIMKTMQAWVASIKTAGTIMLRAGLDKMYIDIVGALKDMVGYLIDENGLTEEGIALAYVYTASWESVKTAMGRVRDVGVTIGALYKAFTFDIPVMSNFLWALSSGVMALKYGLKSVIIMIEELRKGFTMPEIKAPKEYFEEIRKELGITGRSLKDVTKVTILGWKRLFSDLRKSWKETNKEMDEENGTVLERIAKRQEQLIIDWNAELMKMKLPHEWLDPGKFEEFAEKIRKTQSELTEEILAMLAKLRKGTGEEDEKARKARLRKERQLLTLMAQMQKDYLVGNFIRFKANADAEYEIRLRKILAIADLEKRSTFEATANKAYHAKIDLYMLNMLKYHTGSYYGWKKTEIEKDTEAMIAAGSKRADAEKRALDELKRLNLEHNQFIMENSDSLIETTSAAWANFIMNSKSVVQKFAEASLELMQTFAQGVGNVFARALIYGENLVAGLRSLAQQIAATIISTLIRVTIERAIQWALSKMLAATEAASRLGVLAAETYAGAFASTVAIPVVGPATAPAVAAASTAAMLAGAAAAGSLGNALGASLGVFDKGGISNIPGLYYAGVPEAHIPLEGGKVPVELGEKKPAVQVDIVNALDPTMLDQYMASARGRDAVVNVIGTRSRSIRRILR